jgi:nucleoside-diphosphate-sugar epimerase
MMIYITGSHGFIGKSLCRLLNKKKIKFKKVKIRKKIKINIFEKLSAKNENILIHLGWGKMNDPWSVYHKKYNYINSVKLFSLVKKLNFKKIIFCGSINEYGNKVGKIKETTKPGKIETLYAKSKLKLTNFGLKFFRNSNTKFYTVRPSYVYGPFQRKGTLVDLLIKAWKKKRIIKMTKCKGYRDYIYVDDVANGIIKILLCNLRKNCGIYNLGSQSCITIKDFIISLSKTLNFEKSYLKFGSVPEKKEQMQLKSYLVTEKAFKILGWKQKYTLEKGLKEIYLSLN